MRSKSIITSLQHRSIADIFINISHFIDHFIMLIFAKAAYDAGRFFGLGYDEIISYGAAGFLLFGAMAPLAAKSADRFSRSMLMVVFHFGIGAAAIGTAFAQTVWQMAIGLGVIGIFAAIYHPVGIAMLLKNPKNIGFRLGVNGVFGNLGVAAAPLFMGVMILYGDWRLGFWVAGSICVIYGVIFMMSLTDGLEQPPAQKQTKMGQGFAVGWQRALCALALVTSAGGFVFGAMTFLVPRYFDIALTNLTHSIAITGILASLVYAIASFSQIGVGWLIDRISAKSVLLVMACGQVLFIYLASHFKDLGLFFVMVAAMCFVFGQIPITDAIMSRYVPDQWRARVLSIKFLLNLCIGATVLPLCGIMLQSGFEMFHLFIIISIIATFIVFAALILPIQPAMSAQETPK